MSETTCFASAARILPRAARAPTTSARASSEYSIACRTLPPRSSPNWAKRSVRPHSVALTGNLTTFHGPARSLGYRWFTDPATRELYAPEEHSFMSRMFASGLRGTATLRGGNSKAAEWVELLLARSDEFREVWNLHEVGIRPREIKHVIQPELGPIELSCQTLLDMSQSHVLLVYTAAPGSESYEKLQLLSVIGDRARY